MTKSREGLRGAKNSVTHLFKLKTALKSKAYSSKKKNKTQQVLTEFSLHTWKPGPLERVLKTAMPSPQLGAENPRSPGHSNGRKTTLPTWSSGWSTDPPDKARTLRQAQCQDTAAHGHPRGNLAFNLDPQCPGLRRSVWGCVEDSGASLTPTCAAPWVLRSPCSPSEGAGDPGPQWRWYAGRETGI